MDWFLGQDSNLLLLFSYLDARSLVQVSRVSKRWKALVHDDDTLWARLGKRLGFENAKWNDQTWKECVQDLYCVVDLDSANSSRPISLLKLECTACWRHLSSLKQKQLAKRKKEEEEEDLESEASSLMSSVDSTLKSLSDLKLTSPSGFEEDSTTTDTPTNNNTTATANATEQDENTDPVSSSQNNENLRICRLHKVKMTDKKLCIRCKHLGSEHCVHLQYREAQLNRYFAAYDRKDYEEMVRRISAIIRIAGGVLRSQEENLLSASYHMYINYLKSEWKAIKNKGRQELEKKDELSGHIVRVSRKLLRILDDKIFPYMGLNTIIRWIKLKINFCDNVLTGVNSLIESENSSSNLITNDIAAMSLEDGPKLNKRQELSNLKESMLATLKELKSMLDQVSTHHEILNLPPSDPIVLQLAISYGEYCDTIIHNRMRAYRLCKAAYDDALTALAGQENQDNKLLSIIETFLTMIETSKVLNKKKCQRVVKQGYLRKKDTIEGELTLPCWVVFGYWDYHTCIYIYEKIESEEANEIILLSEGMNVEVQEDSDRSFRIGVLPTIWYASTTKERDEWCFVLESAKKTL